MKRLYLLRHAKSAWDEPGLPDLERGLNQRGRRAAHSMGRALSQLLPTAGFASMRLEIDHWRDILQGCAILEKSLFPRDLADS